MTKIKDLAAVTVDTAFTMFPVDLERYELLIYVQNMVALALCESDCELSEPKNYRVREFVLSTQENLLSACSAFKRVALGEANLPLIVHDRARRFAATITNSFDDLEFDPATLWDKPVETLTMVLWGCILGRMHGTQGFLNAVPKDMELLS